MRVASIYLFFFSVFFWMNPWKERRRSETQNRCKNERNEEKKGSVVCAVSYRHAVEDEPTTHPQRRAIGHQRITALLVWSPLAALLLFSSFSKAKSTHEDCQFVLHVS